MEESWGDLARQLLWEMNPQDNSHGSGAIFKKFLDKFVGTGQGTAVHGWGHYSADNPNTAARYVLQKNKPITFDAFPDAKIQELDLAYNNKTDLKPRSDYLYKVNVPNEKFMINLERPLKNQSDYIKRAIEKFYNSKDIPSTTKDAYKYLDIGEVDDTKYLYRWLAQDIADSYSPEIKWLSEDDRVKIGSKDASKILNKYGIKGIRTTGRTDGPINVVFSDKNIKMANTPIQRFTNRIPTQTLGKMARKLMESPAVRIGGKLLEGSATPLMILDMLNLQGIDPRAVLDKNYRNKLIQQNRNRIY